MFETDLAIHVKLCIADASDWSLFHIVLSHTPTYFYYSVLSFHVFNLINFFSIWSHFHVSNSRKTNFQIISNSTYQTSADSWFLQAPWSMHTALLSLIFLWYWCCLNVYCSFFSCTAKKAKHLGRTPSTETSATAHHLANTTPTVKHRFIASCYDGTGKLLRVEGMKQT